jgi:hypothetical protein
MDLNMTSRQTKNQVARGARADAERSDAFFLLKNVSALRLTYQIRVLSYRAFESGRKFVIRVPAGCHIHPSLKAFQNENAKILRIEKV